MPWTDTVWVLLLKVTLVLGLGLAAAALARRRSAAVRHAIWATTLAGVLVVPIVMIGAPAWRVQILPARQVIAGSGGDASTVVGPVLLRLPNEEPWVLASVSAVDGQFHMERATTLWRPQPGGLSPQEWAMVVWLVGIAIGLIWLVAGHLGLRSLQRRAEPLDTEAWRTLLLEECARAGVRQPVSLLMSAAVGTPVTWGLRRSVILLPLAAQEWTRGQQRVALRHELAHIARRDIVAQLGASLARIVYWFHPVVWLAAARLRFEGERACDERVVWLGTSPTEYAAQLLALARTARAGGTPALVSVAMARPSQLEQRLRAILFVHRTADALDRRSRRTPDRRGAIVTGTLVAILVVSVAVLQPVVRESAHLDREAAAIAARSVISMVPAPTGSVSGTPTSIETQSKGGKASHGNPSSAAVLSPLPFALPPTPADKHTSRLSNPCALSDSTEQLAAQHLPTQQDGLMPFAIQYGRCTIRLQGAFTRTEDGKDLARLTPGGRFVLEQRFQHTVRKVEVVRDTAGGLTRIWSINGSARPYDDEAREILAEVLRVLHWEGSSLLIGHGPIARLTVVERDGTGHPHHALPRAEEEPTSFQ